MHIGVFAWARQEEMRNVNGEANVYCDESTHLPTDGHPYMVLGALSCSISSTREATDHLVKLRRKHGLAKDFEIKWGKVSPGRASFYLDVVDYFFDNEALQFRAVVANKAGLSHAKFSQSHDDWYYKMMFLLLHNIVIEKNKSRIYLDKKDTRGGMKVKKLYEVISNAKYDFKRTSIERVQIVESHHVGLMQLADLLIGAVNYANRGLSASQAKLSVINRIQERSGTLLTRTTPLRQKKFNLFMWQPQRRSG